MYFHKINQSAANLWIEGMEAPLWEIEGIVSCTHQRQGSNQCQALPSDQLYLENPTHPVGSTLSTQPAWWATNTAQDVQSCRCTPATVAGVPAYLTWPMAG